MVNNMKKGFNSTQRKFRKIWDNVNSNKANLEIVRDKQIIMLNRKSWTKPVYLTETSILDLSSDWEVFSYNIYNNYVVSGGDTVLSTDIDDLQTVIKRWTLQIDNFKLREMSAIHYNLLTQFVSTSKEYDEFDNIENNFDIYTPVNYYAESLDLDEVQRIYFDFGIYFNHNTLVPEWLGLNWKVKLDLRLIPANLYL